MTEGNHNFSGSVRNIQGYQIMPKERPIILVVL